MNTEQKILEAILSNQELALCLYVFISCTQIFYLKYYFSLSNVMIFLVNKLLTFYFLIFKLLFQQEKGASVHYGLFLMFFLVAVTIWQKQKIFYKIQKFFAIDSVTVAIAMFLVSLLDKYTFQ